MAAIPQIDLIIGLNDTHYALPIVTEGDGSSTFGAFGLSPGRAGFGAGVGNFYSVSKVATFPAYNSNFSTPVEAAVNFQLFTDHKTQFATVAAGFDDEWSTLDPYTGKVLVLDTSDMWLGAGGVRGKLQAWPGIVDYSVSGMVALTIPNQSSGLVFTALSNIILTDGSSAFCLTAFSFGTGVLPSGYFVLMIRSDLSTSGWFPDLFSVPSCSYRFGAINYQCTLGASNSVAMYSLTYNFAAGETVTLLGTGEVSAHAYSALNENEQIFLTPIGVFGIDFSSGQDTGCWYCALDCSAFGRVNFTMPDASIGPSSSATVWNNFYGRTNNTTYPNWDVDGNAWWVRLPLCDGAGVLVLEPLTSEVYTAVGAGVAGWTPPINQTPPFILPWPCPCRPRKIMDTPGVKARAWELGEVR